MAERQIYADHAATTQLSKVALEAMLSFMREEFAAELPDIKFKY